MEYRGGGRGEGGEKGQLELVVASSSAKREGGDMGKTGEKSELGEAETVEDEEKEEDDSGSAVRGVETGNSCSSAL
jgi:hypothetical protein